MFGRATIRLGIGPHSSLYNVCIELWLAIELGRSGGIGCECDTVTDLLVRWLWPKNLMHLLRMMLVNGG